MAVYEPAYLPPDAEEQDFIQAYESVREKYKGESLSDGILCMMCDRRQISTGLR